MKRLLVPALLTVAALAGCELGPLEEDGQPRISVLIKDARPALSGGKESLFDIHYCAGSQGESYLVSELRVDLDAQGVSWRSGYNLRYELTWDDNRDHRFGPGDVLTVSERDWDEFGAEDVGTTWGVTLYRVPDMGFDELLAKADWAAR